MKVGQKIREIRTAKSMSQKDLGDKCGISARMISHIENGKTKLSIDTVKKIATGLSVNPIQLLWDELAA